MIYTCFKFHEIRFRGYLVIAKYIDFKSIQGAITHELPASLTKLNVHQCPMVIYISFKFHETRFRGYLVIANYMDFKSIQGL